MIKSFTDWYQDNRAAFEMENQIIADKLSQGIDGVEWLVLNILPKPSRIERLSQWFEFLYEDGHDCEKLMFDALTMGSDSFYKRYEHNWWMAVDNTLAHLHVLRIYEYDRYFNFLQKIRP
ncbi:hypothetical protein QP794_02725 [Paenibacillus sp. UMB7766-LJ446]|uniref:hypothetical protein n=1 Tax=Paenibacillus sp. UMB7766-LJ446 TaxID=3046313 RepID=UPI00254CF9C0|nr:hypothetical protein [Paenibacillus sp. UMB7766-LJ446]MDK8189000.1 hypothetical protein [Paenibacillus sp. UMB7766-LJ446]